METKEFWIENLGLHEHPEGGYFKETYRSNEQLELSALNKKWTGKRSLATGIYFLIDSGNFSAFHRIKSDEMWHFYAGDTLLVHMIDPLGDYSYQKVGKHIEAGEKLQFVVPANTWFASEVVEGGNYSLVGCTVSFGFDFDDFELAEKGLLHEFPEHKEVLSRLIR